MILIADSGSTKCDWVMVDRTGNRIKSFRTMGFNPYFHSEEDIYSHLISNPDFQGLDKKVVAVFFYGAGCSAEYLNAEVERALERFFPEAQVQVDHDLVAAAYATYDGEPAITCILGTGSNSCYFDGEKVTEEVPALAYILGDEGSGSYYGKRLLADYLYKRLPEPLERAFRFKYNLSKDEIIDRVYHRPNANVYLASFSTFFSEYREEPYCIQIIREGFNRFLDIHVGCFPNSKEVPVHFVGSLATIFEDTLRQEASRLNIQVGRLVRRPIDGLVNYHLQVKIPELELS